jgi:RNA polymerase sigma factor (sigma-70 family)
VKREESLDVIYLDNLDRLVGLADVILLSATDAEDVVQEAYLRVRSRAGELREPLAYLRQSVVNQARSTLRRRRTALRFLARSHPEPEHVPDSFEHHSMIAALRTLGPRTREALALRYYADLSVEQTAAAMGVSAGTVKGYCARGLQELNVLMGERS